MEASGHVGRLEDCGDHVRVDVINVKGKSDADWRAYWKSVEVQIPHSRQGSFPIGRKVKIDITPV
jgi:hypothetical protein